MIRLEFALRTVSALNSREHHMVRSRRVKNERNRVRLELAKAKVKPPGPLLVVRLTRISPGTLDDDAVPGALKGVRDQLACWLGIDDRSSLVRWAYRQRKGPAGVEVEVGGPGDFEGLSISYDRVDFMQALLDELATKARGQ